VDTPARIDHYLSRLRGPRRVLVWVVLALLTSVLLSYPVHLTNQYRPIQAPYIFDNLPLFASLFCVWLVLVFLLLFSGMQPRDRLKWEDMALAALFGLVFLGFWVVITPNGRYSANLFNMGHVMYLADTGKILVSHPILGYFDFPGMHLLVSSLSQITGLGVPESAAAFIMFNSVLLSVLLCVLFARILKDTRLAFLGMLLVIMGGTTLVDDLTIFFPRAFGFTLLIASLLVLMRQDGTPFAEDVSDRLLLVVLFAAMVMSYFATSFLLLFILVGICAVRLIAKDRGMAGAVTVIVLFSALFLAWQFYWTYRTANSLVGFLPDVAGSLSSGEFLKLPSTLATSNIGARVPVWASLTRYFWWALLGLGTLLGLSNLFRLKRMTLTQKTETGALLGVILLSALGFFGTVRGSQFERYLMYAPLFCAPILLGFLSKSGAWGKKALALMPIAVFVVALPTFLSSVNTVSTDAVYSYEIAAGQFLEANSHDQGNDISLYFASDVSKSWAYVCLPNVRFVGVSEAVYYDEDLLWQETAELASGFSDAEYSGERLRFFVINKKTFAPYQHQLSVAPDDTHWEELMRVLSATDIVYVNGHTTLYAN